MTAQGFCSDPLGLGSGTTFGALREGFIGAAAAVQWTVLLTGR